MGATIRFFEKKTIDKNREVVDAYTPFIPDLTSFYIKELAIPEWHLKHMNKRQKKALENDIKYFESLSALRVALGYKKNKDMTARHKRLSVLSRDLPVLRFPDEIKTAFEEMFDEFVSGIKNGISVVNLQRLYLVWHNCFISAINNLIGKETTGHLQDYISDYNFGAGILSFVFYFKRFALEMVAFLKKVLYNHKLEETVEEREFVWLIDNSYRFWTHIGESIVTFINDGFWGVANCVYFFHLTASKFLPDSNLITFADVGGYLTTALLLMDVGVGYYVLWKARKAYNDKHTVLSEGLRELEKSADFEGKSEQIKRYKALIDELNFEWKYQEKRATAGLYYSILLLSSFVIVCFILFPAATVPLQMANIYFLLGSFFSFAWTFGNEAYSGYLTTQIMKEKSDRDLEKVFELLKAFQEIPDNADLCERNYLFLQMREIFNSVANQQAVFPYERAQTIIKSVTQCVLPVLLFLSFTTLSTAAAIGLVVGVLAILAAAYLIAAYSKPKAHETVELTAVQLAKKVKELKETETSTPVTIQEKQRVANHMNRLFQPVRRREEDGRDEHEMLLLQRA